jgi:hypothetical protein
VKQDWKYILYLSIAFLVFLGLKLFSPRELNWDVTFYEEDKNPFGGYAISELMPSIFQDQKISKSNRTIYELKDSLRPDVNFVSLSETFAPGDDDVDVLLKNVAGGGTAFIAAENFVGFFADTLKLDMRDYFYNSEKLGFVSKEDSASLTFTNPLFTNVYLFPRQNTNNYFDSYDSTCTTVLANNDFDLPVLLRIRWGKGNLIVSSTPLVFSNIYLLHENHTEFAEITLSHLPKQDIEWTAFYQLGRLEAGTPLRFILTSEPLRWAYYITILSLILFMIFEAKRKQRIIPIIKPLQNTTLEFVGAIGNLYHQNNEHKSIAEKKINFLLEHIRTKYWMSTVKLDDSFIYTLARKAGKSETDVRDLFRTIQSIHNVEYISDEDLISLNSKIEKFNQ